MRRKKFGNKKEPKLERNRESKSFTNENEDKSENLTLMEKSKEERTMRLIPRREPEGEQHRLTMSSLTLTRRMT